MIFEDVRRLQRGIHLLDFVEFYQVLITTVGADSKYAQDCWKDFQDNPIGYMTSRRGGNQGEELFKLCWEKGK